MLASYVDAMVRVQLSSGHALEGLLLCFDTSTGWAVVLAPQADGAFAAHGFRADSVADCRLLPEADWALEFSTAARTEAPVAAQSAAKKRKIEGIAKDSRVNLPLYSKTKKPDKLQQLLDVADPLAPPKFWAKRYQLFAEFSNGIQLDAESWYSVTPQSIAEHIAERVRCSVIVDSCAGVGGNAIQFAQTCHGVIAIENNPARIAMAKHNASVYNVANRIEFILGNCLSVLDAMRPGDADVVFLSPPWGGMDYNRAPDGFDVETQITLRSDSGNNVSGLDLVRACQRITPNVVLYVPRSVNRVKLGAMGPVAELQLHVVKGKETTMCAYFGPLFQTR